MRILVIGMADSVHVGRWLELSLANETHEILFIPTSPHRRIHPKIVAMTRVTSEGRDFKLHPVLRYLSLPVWVIDKLLGLHSPVRSWFIYQAIRKFKPTFIHVLEAQNGGYPFAVASTREGKSGTGTPTLLTLFGSDLFWFSKFPKHEALLKRLLKNVNLVSAECERDQALAREIGFEGAFLPLIPVAGGLETSLILQTPDDLQSRKSIAIKGYGGTWGQGYLAIEALGDLEELIQGLTIEVFSASRKSARAAKKHLAPTGVAYKIHPKHSLNHDEMLALFRRSLLYIGLSKSDGLPASMLEAMSQGTFPIQTATACTSGWVKAFETSMILDDISLDALEHSISSALTNRNRLVSAQVKNLQTIREKYTREALQGQGTWGYSAILNDYFTKGRE